MVQTVSNNSQVVTLSRSIHTVQGGPKNAHLQIPNLFHLSITFTNTVRLE